MDVLAKPIMAVHHRKNYTDAKQAVDLTNGNCEAEEREIFEIVSKNIQSARARRMLSSYISRMLGLPFPIQSSDSDSDRSACCSYHGPFEELIDMLRWKPSFSSGRSRGRELRPERLSSTAGRWTLLTRTSLQKPPHLSQSLPSSNYC